MIYVIFARFCDFFLFVFFSFFSPDSMALHEYFSDALFCSPEKHCIFNKVDKLYKSVRVFSLVLPFFNLFFFSSLHFSERGRAFVVAFFVHILQNIRKNIITNIEFVATTDSIPHRRKRAPNSHLLGCVNAYVRERFFSRSKATPP